MNNLSKQSRHVLLADDDLDDCMLFEDVLRELYGQPRFSVVNDGRQLMKLLASENPLPDIIFLDLNMPLKNGYECVKEIRQTKRLQHIPIVIFSTSAKAAAVEVLYEQGINLYIKKPDDFRLLIAVVEKVMAIDWTTFKPVKGEVLDPSANKS
jgi:CheY-like chemotaxis protein